MIAILMSTYNGARFLREQLDSIIRQTYSDWALYVRDDGSTDDTEAIIGAYAAQDARIRSVDNGGQNLGAMRSFEALLSIQTGADYTMFADQDDVWLPDKLDVTLRSMREVEFKRGAGTPVLVHTDLKVVNEHLELINPSFWAYSNIHPEWLDCKPEYLGICNSVTGCTMMLNRAAISVCLPFSATASMHDAWIALRVLTMGGVIVPVAYATILYRQHTQNTLGATPYRFTLGEWKKKWRLAMQSYRNGQGLVWKNLLHFMVWKIRYFRFYNARRRQNA